MEENQNKFSTMIGMGLIFLLLYLWMQYSAPPPKTPEEIAATQTEQAAEQAKQNNASATNPAPNTAVAPVAPVVPDSLKSAVAIAQFGAFAGAWSLTCPST